VIAGNKRGRSGGWCRLGGADVLDGKSTVELPVFVVADEKI
jgi:hypothetical protein